MNSYILTANSNIIILRTSLALIMFWDYIDYFFTNATFIIVTLLLAFMLVLNNSKNTIPKNILILMICILLHGAVNVLFNNNSIELFIKQYINIAFNFFLFWNIIKINKINKIIDEYIKMSFIVASFACIQEFLCVLSMEEMLQLPFGIFDKVLLLRRVSSVCKEPSFLGYLLIPAFTVIVFAMIDRKKYYESLSLNFSKTEAFVIFLALVFSFSLVGYLGMLVSISLGYLAKRGLSKLLYILPLSYIPILIYSIVPTVQMRVDDTISAFLNIGDISSANLSSFTFYSNFVVCVEALKNSLFMGFGLGSFYVSYQKYNIGGWGLEDLMLNSADGNSMMFRLLAELGLISIILVLMYYKRYFVPFGNPKSSYSCAVLALMLILLLRQGHYTHGGVFLFFCLYYKNYLDYINTTNRENCK